MESERLALGGFKWERLALLVIVCCGLAVRTWLNIRSAWMIDGDEALFGIGAERVLRGEFPVFLYGVPYMGMIQSYLAAPFIAVFGPRPAALRMATLLEALLFIAATWHLARVLVGREAGLWAAAIAALPALYVAVEGLKVWGSYTGVMAAGSEVMAQTWLLRHSTGAILWKRWLAIGLLTGLALWSNDLVIYYLITACFLVPWNRLAIWAGWSVPALLIGLMVGGAPLWGWNVANGFATVHFLTAGAGVSNPRYGAVAHVLVTQLLPRVLGWANPWAIGRAAFVARPIAGAIAVGGLLMLMVGLVATRYGKGQRQVDRGTSWPLIVLLVVIVVVYLVSGFGRPSLTPFDASGRYLLPLWTVVAIGTGLFLSVLASHWRWIAWSLFVIYAIATLISYRGSQPRLVFQSPYWPYLPLDSRPLVRYLEAQGLHEVWMNHWAGDGVMFLTDGRILTADYYDVLIGRGINRFPKVFEAVWRSPYAAFVVILPKRGAVPPLRSVLEQHHIPFREQLIGRYDVFLPLDGRVNPAEVIAGLRYPY